MTPGHTLLSLLLPEQLPAGRARRTLLLCGEGAFHATAAVLVASWTGIPQSGLVALLLCTAGLTRRFDQLLDENRRGIYEERRPSPAVNARTAKSLLALFAGLLASFAGVALFVGEAHLGADFGFVLQLAGLGEGTLATRHFGSTLSLLQHNCLVLLTALVLALLYRGYGALLVLAFNACVWGMALALLAHRGFGATGMGALPYAALALAAVLPHLLLEVVGYLLGALAGIYVSKALAQYGLDDPRTAEVLRASGVLLALSLVAVAAGAVVEATIAPRLLGELPVQRAAVLAPGG